MNDKKDAGYIIIVVTVILVALSLMGMTFLNLTSVDFTATDNYVNSLQADMAARAGLDYATYVLKMDKYGTDTIVYNNNSYRYRGTSTLGYDENYDAYTEEWLGPGRNTIFGSATASNNVVDNNGDGTPDSNWLDAPFSLDRGLKAQYAILIEDIGESRINVNATGNVVGAAGSFVYGTGATTYDIRLQDVLTDTVAKNVIGTTTGRCGANETPGSTGTTASQFQPRNPVGDDRPFNVLDAADICFGTCTSSSLYKSRLRNIINNETLFQSVRGSLTAYSFDALIANNGISNLKLNDNINYYRLKLDNQTTIGSITSQLQISGFGVGTATQLAVHAKDYMDSDTDITAYGTSTKYGLEPHPFINELYHTGTNSASPCQHRIELYNPFDVTIATSTMSINGSKMDLVLMVTKAQYARGIDDDDDDGGDDDGDDDDGDDDDGDGEDDDDDYDDDDGVGSCDWENGTVTSTIYPIGTTGFSMQPKGYVVLGYDQPGAIITITSLSGTQTVTGFNIYDFDTNDIPQAVTVTLMGSSSALGSGNYLILDKVSPSAYNNTIRGEDVLWLLYQLIDYLYDKTYAPGNTPQETQAFQSLLNRSGEGEWDGTAGAVVEHTSTQSGNNALERLTSHVLSLGGGDYIVQWDPGVTGIDEAISELNALITATNNNQQIDDTVETEIIADTQEIIDLLNNAKCSSGLSIRASIGERKNPLIEKSNNWGTATTHTLGGTNTSFSSVPTNEKKQLVIANNNMISLGEAGHLLTIGYGTQSTYTNNSLYTSIGSSTVDNAKLSLTSSNATTIPDYFTILDPKNDGIDDDADGAIGTDTGSQSGDIDGPEIQVPGRININTASAGVLSALPGTSTNTSLGTWSALIGTATGNSLLSNIINARPFTTIGAITSVTGMNYFGTDNVDNDGDGFIDEKDEKDLIFTSIANLITTHSNVFAVYVTGRIVNSSASQTFAEKKLVAIVDRSVNPIKIRYFRWMTEW